jgi:DNA (cytosine-5)-methyltransferase 1
MSRPRLLDLFCCAGGAGAGYTRAGFDVTGVDRDPQPNYPYPFIQADALSVLADQTFMATFTAVGASPPCQTNSSLASLPHVAEAIRTGKHVDLITETRAALIAWAERTGGVWVIENVVGAALRDPLVLCGTEFDLHVDTATRGRVWLQRHRPFESNRMLMGAGGCYCGSHRGRIIGVYGTGDGGTGRGWEGSFAERKAVMGIDWMTREELAQAIPPAYTQHLGAQLLDHLSAHAGVAA